MESAMAVGNEARDEFLAGLPDIEHEYPLTPGREFCYCVNCFAPQQHALTRRIPEVFTCRAINPIHIKRKWNDLTASTKYCVMTAVLML
jgi:hypothetical protein